MKRASGYMGMGASDMGTLSPGTSLLGKYLVDQGVSGIGGVQLTLANGDYLNTVGNAPAALQLDSRSFSFAGWFRAEDISTSNFLLSLYLGSPHRGLQVFVNGTGIKVAMFMSGGASSNGAVTVSPAVVVNTWFFLQTSFNVATGDLSISLNNGTVYTSNAAIVTPSLAVDFQLGSLAGASDWDGQLAAWGKWDKVLSSGEITVLYNNGIPLQYAGLSGSLLTGLQAFWNLDQSSGNRLDSVGTAHLAPNGTSPTKVIIPTLWADQGGNGNDITFPASITDRPLWVDAQQNGLPVFRFTRRSSTTGSYCSGPSIGIYDFGNVTILSIGKANNSGRTFPSWSNNDGANGVMLNFGAATGVDVFEDSANMAGIIPVPSPSTYRLLGGQFLGSAEVIFARENGGAGSSKTHGSATLLGLSGFELGRIQPTGYESGDVGDVYLYGSFLTGAQLAPVESPIMSRWSITPGLKSQIVSPTQGDNNTTPSVVKAANGDILVFFNAQPLTTSMYVKRSTDNGASWGSPFLVCAPAGATLVIAPTGAFTRANGDILLPVNVSTVSISDEIQVYKSTDNGATWTLLSTVSAFAYTWTDAYGNIIEPTINGTPILLMPAYAGGSGPFTESLLLQSTDGGVTWTIRSIIAAHTSSFDFSETSVIQVSGSNLLAITREDKNSPPGEIGDLYSETSSDGGLTWTSPSLQFDGTSPSLINSPVSGILLLTTHRINDPYFGVLARRTTNGGSTWGAAYQFYNRSSTGNSAFIGNPSAIVIGTKIGVGYRDDSAHVQWVLIDDSSIT